MRWCIFPALFFLLFSCVNKESTPSGIIKRDTMGIVLWDLIQADQFAKLYLVKDSLKINVNQERLKLYQEVFQIHHITKDQFQQSYQFYMGRPDLTKIMFDSLSAFTTRQRMEAYKSKYTPPVKTVTKPGDSSKFKNMQLPATKPVITPFTKPGPAPLAKPATKPNGR